MPAEGKKVIEDWLATCSDGCNDLKKMVDDNYGKVEAYFNQK
jgi:hypothetical protein